MPTKPAAADEAQAEQPPNIPSGEDAKMKLFQDTFAGMRKTLKAELMGEIRPMKATMEGLAKSVDDLAALLAAQSGGGEAVMLEEDALNDRIEAAIESRFQVTAASLDQGVVERFSQLADDLGKQVNFAFAEHGAPTLTGEYVPGKHILTAIHQVMRAVTFVPKAGEYDGGRSGNYRFRKFDDTAAAIGKAFRDFGVFVQVQTLNHRIENYEKPYSNGNGSVRWTDAYVSVRYVFTSLEDGSELTVESYGQGKDNSDKATAKAMTMALKTALTQAFMIPTDEPDPDAERPGEQEAPPIGNGQEQRPAVQQQRAAERPAPTAEQKQERAAKAFEAAQKARQRGQLAAIINQAVREGIIQTEVTYRGETMPLQNWLISIRRTLPEDSQGEPLPPEPTDD